MKLICICIAMLVVGCGGRVAAPIVVTQYQVQALAVPDRLLDSCTTTSPPEITEYLALDYQGKENALTDYSLHLLKDISVCNAQILALKKLRSQQLTAVKRINNGH